jgi:hypothetical protein
LTVSMDYPTENSGIVHCILIPVSIIPAIPGSIVAMVSRSVMITIWVHIDRRRGRSIRRWWIGIANRWSIMRIS